MKVRFNYILFTLLLCLCLTACGERTITENMIPDTSERTTPIETEAEEIISFPDLDAQNKYAIFNAISFQESDNFFCGNSLIGDRLYYYDKENGISGILCADPSCSHDSSSCGAYVKSGAAMFLYDGLRYWITDDVNTDGWDYILWQGDIAGTNQKKVKTINFEDIILTYQPQQYAIHRGNLYFLGTADTISGVNTGVRLTLMGSPLDKSEEFTALFDQTYNAYVKAGVLFIGNYAFFFVQTWTEAVANPAVDIAIYKIALNNGKMETVYEEPGGTACDGFWVTERGEVYLAKQSAVCKVEAGTLTSAATFKHTGDVVELMDGIAVTTYLEDDRRCVEILDFSGNTLYDGKMFTADIPEMDGDPNEFRTYSMLIVGGDSDKLIINLANFNGNNESYVILLDLHSNLKPTLLWKAE